MKIHFTILFSVLFLSLSGQITLTNRLLPAIGDSLAYAIDSFAAGVTITPPGGNQSWDFSLLSPIAFRSEIYRHPHEGINSSSFPFADIVVIQGINELYYKLHSNRIELLGTATRAGGTIPGVGTANVYPKPVIVQKYPQNYLDSLSYHTTNSISLSAALLPDTILNSLPPALKPDSFRINYNTRFQKETEAWGTIKLPARSWNVLREKRITENQITADAKVPFFGWTSVTAIVAPYFPGFFENYTSTSYAFVSNETKGLIALVNVDSFDNVIAVQFKPDDRIVLKTSDAGSINTIGVFPNPANNEIYYSINDLPSANYYISIVDLQGKEYSTQKLFIQENIVSKLSIGELPAGSYFIQLSDKKKQKINSGVFQKK